MHKVGIVLVNFNGEKFQNDCIKTLMLQSYENFEIIVVDNGSTDRSVDLLKSEYPNVIVIETGSNNGVAEGNNIGIRNAIERNCEYILLLNNDTEVDKDLINNLMEDANESTMVTGKMYYYEPKNVIWCAGGEMNRNKATTIHYGEDTLDKGQFDQDKFVNYTPTCCLLIHKNIFNKIGLMDPKYFMYYDDTDFCIRAINSGIRILYKSSAKLWHKVSSSSGGRTSKTTLYYATRNRLYFIDKHSKNKYISKTYFYVTRVLKFAKWILLRDRTKVKICMKAIKDANQKKLGFSANLSKL